MHSYVVVMEDLSPDIVVDISSLRDVSFLNRLPVGVLCFMVGKSIVFEIDFCDILFGT